MGHEYRIKLPPPQYQQGNFHQWSLSKEQFPLEDFMDWQLFPQIKWRGREENAPRQIHLGVVLGPSLEEKMQFLKEAPDAVLFDWKSFFPQWDRAWNDFFSFSLPLLPQISIVDGGVILRGYGRPSEQFQLKVNGPKGKSSPILEYRHLPEHSKWKEAIRELQRAFVITSLRKVVLSRKKVAVFQGPVPLAKEWKKLQSFSQKSYEIMIRPKEGTCFFCLSPEMLFCKEGLECRAEAIAGSRGDFTQEKGREESAKELMASEKDRYEHEIVIESIRDEMRPLCRHWVCHETEVLNLDLLQHLKTRLEFILKGHVTASMICNALHPTPALGGMPRKMAMEMIMAYEPFDRGLYGAPLGRLDKDKEEYVVGIRSALALGNELHIFAGAGIVPLSVPKQEWREVETKMGHFL